MYKEHIHSFLENMETQEIVPTSIIMCLYTKYIISNNRVIISHIKMSGIPCIFVYKIQQ